MHVITLMNLNITYITHHVHAQLRSTYFPEDGVDVLPQRVVVFDGFADFSHLLQQNRRLSENGNIKPNVCNYWRLSLTSMTSSRFSSASAFSVISLDALK